MANNSKTEKFINFIKKNQTTVLTILGFIVGISLFLIFVYTRMQVLNANSSDQLTMATQYIASNQIEKGVNLLDNIITKYSNTTSAYRAMIMKANYLYAQKEYEQSKTLALNIISNAKPKTIKPLAYPLLIANLENLGNIQEAIDTSKQFIENYSSNFLIPSVMENLVRLYKENNNIEEAKVICAKLEALFPNSIHFQIAQNQIK